MSSHDGLERVDNSFQLAQTTVLSQQINQVSGFLGDTEVLGNGLDSRTLLVSFQCGVQDEFLNVS